jgi:hypothetical protein
MTSVDQIIEVLMNGQMLNIISLGTTSKSDLGRFYQPNQKILLIELTTGIFIEIMSLSNFRIHLSLRLSSDLCYESLFNGQEICFCRLESLLVGEFLRKCNIAFMKVWYQEGRDLEDCNFYALEFTLEYDEIVLFFSTDTSNDLKVGNQSLRGAWLQRVKGKQFLCKVYDLRPNSQLQCEN